MRSKHTSRQEVVKMVHDHLGPDKALDVGQRHLKIKKPTLLQWFKGWDKGTRRKTVSARSSARR